MNFNEIADRKIANARLNIELLIFYSDVSFSTISQIIGENKRYITRMLANVKAQDSDIVPAKVYERELTLPAIIKIAELFEFTVDELFEDTAEFIKRFRLPKSKLNKEAVNKIKQCIKPFLQNS